MEAMDTNLSLPVDEAARWRAVENRDPRFDGAFVYGVSSTGIYCRPSCSSRQPRRDRVAFFPLAEAAEQAGYRACKRCRPHETAPTDRRVDVVRRLCRAIEAFDEGVPTLADLAGKVGGSPHHLQKLFKRIMGISPRQYAEAIRLDRFKGALRDGEPVTAALYEAGYGSSSRLYEKAPGHLGMTPASYAKGGRGADIAYTIVASPLGRLLVAGTARGLCAVSLGDDDAELEKVIAGDFPEARRRRDDGALAAAAGAIVAHVEGSLPHVELPLDVRATAFQWQVWQCLSAIPRGETRTYGDIARQLGRPGAARAVGRACATNPVALVVPCHRAVGAGGTLSGYRWGGERKKDLLSREAADRSPPD